MKQIMRFAVVLFIVSLLVPSIVFAQDDGQWYRVQIPEGVVVEERIVALRLEPNQESNVLVSVPEGDQVYSVSPDDVREDYRHVEYNGSAGWMSIEALLPIDTNLLVQEELECQYESTGSSQPEDVWQRVPNTDLYWFDPATTGCAFLIEGRFPWQDDVTEMPSYLQMLGIAGEDGSEWMLWDVHHLVADNFDFVAFNALDEDIPEEYQQYAVCTECSVFFYDPSWNMNDLGTSKPSIAEELEAAKLAVMQEEGYLWPRVIWDETGAAAIFYEDSSGAQFYQAGCTSGDQPELVPVHGMRVGNNEYKAAVGKVGCTTVAWIDGEGPEQWDGQRDADRSVEYSSSVEAWMIPDDWSQDQIDAWVASR